MKRSRTYRHAVQIMRYLVKAGFTHQIDQSSLDAAITVLRGGDPRTLKNWKRNLLRLDFLKRVTPRVYQINLKGVPEVLSVAVKQGQKKLM